MEIMVQGDHIVSQYDLFGALSVVIVCMYDSLRWVILKLIMVFETDCILLLVILC